MLMGDFNNVLTSQDRVGGNVVHPNEYVDLADMMERAELFEVDSIGDHYTWHNKHTADPIYSRIDRVLANMAWLQNFSQLQVEILDASVSDHALLRLNLFEVPRPPKKQFRFINKVADLPDFVDTVRRVWNEPVRGRGMYVVWTKLRKLQPVIRQLQRKYAGIRITIEHAREQLRVAQENLNSDRMNAVLIEQVKHCTNNLLHWNEAEEAIMQQRAKVDWIRLGDANNSYFHANVKAKHRHSGLDCLQLNDGTMVTTPHEIEHEILNFYSKLVGQNEERLEGIDITIMRDGPHVTREQAAGLIGQVTRPEIHAALAGIGDLKAPGLDGYNAKFFKASWGVIEMDVVQAVREFFEQGQMYKAVNRSIVTLIPKIAEAKSVKDFRPISCCTTLYKIVSKILTNQFSKVLPGLVHESQAAFTPGQQIHNHILLA